MNKILFSIMPLLLSSSIFCAPCSLHDCQRKSESAARKSDYAIEEIILNRWSPRAMSGEEISDAELMPLFEAARWAPSSYNEQPWRFIYAKRGTKYWDIFLNLLVPFNQEWAKNASVLVVIISKKNFTHNNQYSVTHSFDAGAAWQNLALQASANGLVTHGMGGFDYARAAKELGISDEYQVEAMVAIGKPGNTKNLPDYMQKQETPSGRKPVSELVFEGKFKQ
jgi:nitroreductase